MKRTIFIVTDDTTNYPPRLVEAIKVLFDDNYRMTTKRKYADIIIQSELLEDGDYKITLVVNPILL